MQRLIYSGMAIVIFAAAVTANTLHVPADYVTIQGAIDGSVSGDTILVAPGTFSENINYIGKSIVVKSSNGPAVTTLTFQTSGIPVVTFAGGEDMGARIEGFKIRGDSIDYGIYIDGASPYIYNNIISGHEAGIRGVNCDSLVVRSNEIVNCEHKDLSPIYGGAISLENSADVLIDSNTIHDNYAYRAAGIYLYNCSNTQMRRNLIHSNIGQRIGGVWIEACTDVEMINNIVANNSTTSSNKRGVMAIGENVNLDIKNNIIAFNDEWGIWLGLANTNMTIDFDDFYENNLGDITNFLPGPGAIFDDPLFVDLNSDNYHLTSNSPCINAGDPLTPKDPDSTWADIGVYFHPTVPVYGAIAGTVTDSLNNALPGAVVQIVGTMFIDTTDLSGDYSLPGLLAPYACQMRISYDGYNPKNYYHIRLSGSETIQIDARMGRQGVVQVPAEMPSVYDALGITDNFDTISVAPGEYVENLNFSGKAVVLISELGPEFTTISPGLYDGSVIIFDHGEDRNSILSGFTVSGANAGAVKCNGSSPIIQNCILESNINQISYSIGGAIVVENNAAPLIRNNIFRINNAYNGGAIGFENCDTSHRPVVENNVFHNNSSTAHGSAIWAQDCSFILRGNIIYENYAGYHGSAIFINAFDVAVENNTICGNFGSLDAVIYSSGGTLESTIRNNIFYYNVNQEIYEAGGGVNHVRYNCFYPEPSLPFDNIDLEEGNIFVFPDFIDPDNENYQIFSTSPCVNAGDPASDPDPDNTVADMGALYFHLTPGEGYLAGLVRNSSGMPLSGYIAKVLNGGVADTTGIDGKFLCGPLNAPIAYLINFTHAVYKDTSFGMIYVYADDTTSLELIVNTPGSVAGYVFDQDSAPIENAKVSILGDEDYVETDYNGYYLLSGIDPGPHHLLFSHRTHFDHVEEWVAVNPDGLTELNVNLNESASMEGSILTPELASLTGAKIRFLNIPYHTIYTFTDGFGYYGLYNLPSRGYQVEFSHLCYQDLVLDWVQLPLGSTYLYHATLEPYDSYEFEIWIGNPDGSPIIAPIGERFDVDIYIQTADSISADSIYISLGADKKYIRDLYGQLYGQYYEPFTFPGWIYAEFQEPIDTFPNYKGWFSQAFIANTHENWPYPPAQIHFDTPTKILSFSVRPNYNPMLIADTVNCLSFGEWLNETPVILGDSLGNIYSRVNVHISPLLFGSESDYGTWGGTIVDESLIPINGARVDLLDCNRTIYTDSTGSYSFNALIPDFYQIMVSHPHYLQTETSEQFISQGEVLDLDIVMPYLGYTRGVITDTNLVPVEGVSVELSGISEMVGLTGADGMFNFDYIQPGQYSIAFSHPFYVDTALANISIASGDTAAIDLALRPYPFDIFLWFGGDFIDSAWTELIAAETGGKMNVDVWLTNKESYLGELGCALGIDRGYFDGFIQDECVVHYPLTEWDVAEFGNAVANDSVYSLSFTGEANTDGDVNPWLHNEIPENIITFAVDVKNDYGLSGQQLSGLLFDGIDPVFGGSYARDTSGVIDYTIWSYYPDIQFYLTAFKYLPGDVNMHNGQWPPAVIGADVTYLVNYFRGSLAAPPCYMLGFWASADANGDCQIIGSDVTKLVNYFKGIAQIEWCADYETAWPTPGDLPLDEPADWPGCEPPALSGQRVKTGSSVKR